MRPIRFKGSSSVFSNFCPHWIEDKDLGLMFFSVEQGYQHQCALFNGYDNIAEEILSVKPEHDVGRKCKMIAKKITTKQLVNSEANARRINLVEQCFGTSGQPLVMPHRVLVGEGVLTKMCRKKPKRRQFFLFNDTLVYGNIIIDKKKYNKQHIIPLENVKLESVPDFENARNGWQIISPSKSFTVYAATATEKQEWMAHIQKCVQDLITKHGKQRSSAEDSPVWVPDAEAKLCMHCKKTEFTVLNRRHHCRKCGIVCCNNCSNKRWLLPEQSSKPLRVCLTCYDKLSASVSTQRKSAAMNPGNPEDSSGEDSSDDDDEETANQNGDTPKFYSGK